MYTFVVYLTKDSYLKMLCFANIWMNNNLRTSEKLNKYPNTHSVTTENVNYLLARIIVTIYLFKPHV